MKNGRFLVSFVCRGRASDVTNWKGAARGKISHLKYHKPLKQPSPISNTDSCGYITPKSLEGFFAVSVLGGYLS